MKKYKVILLDEAIKDFTDAFNYYKEINAKLANQFYIYTDLAIKDLKKNLHYQVRYDDFRMKIIKKFPFIIHFRIDETNFRVLIYGVRNSYQNPKTFPKI